MSRETIVTDFGGFIKAIDLGEKIYLDHGTNSKILEQINEEEEGKRTA